MLKTNWQQLSGLMNSATSEMISNSAIDLDAVNVIYDFLKEKDEEDMIIALKYLIDNKIMPVWRYDGLWYFVFSSKSLPNFFTNCFSNIHRDNPFKEPAIAFQTVTNAFIAFMVIWKSNKDYIEYNLSL